MKTAKLYALIDELFQRRFRRMRAPEWMSIRMDFSLVLTLILDELRVILSVVWILLFINRMPTAAIFAIAMGMIDLRVARAEKTLSQLRQSVGKSDVDIQAVYPVL